MRNNKSIEFNSIRKIFLPPPSVHCSGQINYFYINRYLQFISVNVDLFLIIDSIKISVVKKKKQFLFDKNHNLLNNNEIFYHEQMPKKLEQIYYRHINKSLIWLVFIHGQSPTNNQPKNLIGPWWLDWVVTRRWVILKKYILFVGG